MTLLKHKYKAGGETKESSDWYFRFSSKGKIYFGSTGTSNKTLAAKVEAKKKQGVVEQNELGINQTITVDQALENYWNSVSHSGEIRNITTHCDKLRGSKKQNRQHAGDEIKIFGFDSERAFNSITITDLQNLVLARRKEGNSNGTILGELSTLSLAIKLNAKLGHPVPTIDFAALKKDNNLKPSKGRLRYLSKEEEAALLTQLHPDTAVNGAGCLTVETIRSARQDIYDLVVVLLGTGARYNEIAKLRWKDVDLKNKTIGLYRPKVKNESTMHMTDRVFAVLSQRNRDGKYVFQNKNGQGRNYAPGAFQSACKRAVIEGITLHSIRHTFASRLVQAGISLYEVQGLLGHSSSVTTARYAHLVPNHAASKAASILNSIDSQE